jgi:hypothetical protein
VSADLRPPRRTVNTKRIVAALLAVPPCAAGATAVPAVGAPRTPPCADITDGSAFYDSTGVHGRMILGAAACKRISYTMYVTDGTTTDTLLTTATGIPTTMTNPDGSTTYAVTFDTAVTDPTPDSGVCVYVVTSHGKQVYDVAPDDGCAPLVIDGGAGGQRFH